MRKNLLTLGWIFVALIVQATQLPLLGSELGNDLIYNRTDRLDTGLVTDNLGRPITVGSSVIRIRDLVFWKPDLEEGEKLQIVAEFEDYTLEHANGTELVQLDLNKVHPRYKITEPLWKLDLSLLALTVGRGSGAYRAAPGDPANPMVVKDDKDQFFLPGIVGDHTPRLFLFRLGMWDEYDILPLDNNLYTFIVTRNVEVGAGYLIAGNMLARLFVLRANRIYPENFELPRTDFGAEYQWKDPLESGDAANWRELSAKVSRRHYRTQNTDGSDRVDRFLEAEVKSALKFKGESITHFINPKLIFTDSVVVFTRGSTADSLLETTVSQSDFVLHLQYEAFTRLDESPYFLAWGGNYEQSLVQGVRRQWIVHLRITYTY